MKVNLELHTQYGKYDCEILELASEEELEKLKEYARMYHTQTFEAWLQDGSYIVVPTNVLHNSQLFIRFAE